MDIFRGPTDNLYKFLALSGIALLGLGIVLINDLYLSHTEADIEASVAAQIMQHRSEGLKSLMKNQETAEAANSTIDESHNALEAFYRLKVEWLEASSEARVKTEKVFAIERTFTTRLAISCTTILFGLFLTVIGFRLWYTKLQRHLDLKVSADAAAACEKQLRPESVNRSI